MADHTEVLENDYEGFYKLDALKIMFVVVGILITVLFPLLLYSVVWYEREIADIHRRTLVNILLSHVCVISIVRCLALRPPYLFMIIFGPQSRPFCQAFVYFGRMSFLCYLTELVLWQAVKYLHIFFWKYIACYNDDFMANFITLMNVVLSSLFIFCTDILGFYNAEVDYHVCVGRLPNASIAGIDFINQLQPK
jgi:hypothetical protein